MTQVDDRAAGRGVLDARRRAKAARLVLAAVLAGPALGACAPAEDVRAGAAAPAAGAGGVAAPATRIVSLDFCADQFVLEFAARERILALSPDATAGFSYMRDAARGMPTVRPRAEDVLVLRPDLVVRAYGGGAGIAGFMRRAGVPVVQIGFAETLDDVRRTLREVSRALGVPERGEAAVAAMDARLAAVRSRPRGATALYVTPSGVSAGPGTLVHRLLVGVGLENFQREPGWRRLPLERLAYERPDLIAFASFGSGSAYNRAWTPARHPVARRRMREVPVVRLDGATTSCGGWYLADAAEALAAGAARAAAGGVP